MDETGIPNVYKPANIVATKGARAVGKMTSGEKGKNCHCNMCNKCGGTYIPPMFIFPRKRMVESLMHNAPTGALGHCTESGWTDKQSFLKWLKHFTTIAKPSKEEKHIIILDGHHSHNTLEAVEYARLNGIELLTLPLHCTHRMRPLDRAFFKPLKSAYNAAADTWLIANYGKRIRFYDVAEIFATAYNKTATVEKSVNGFRACGLWPYNDAVFSDKDFAAADALAGGLGTLCPENFPSIKKRQKPAEKVNQSVPTANSSVSNQKDVPSTSISVETLSMKKDIETAKIVLKELCRSNSVSSTKKQLQKRSSERSQHFTSSPYKAVLKKKKLTANKKKIPSKFPKKKPRKLFYDFHNEE